ncbi:hypothetical protein K432DRAFT_386380 [Lepidopterella palustris CBS 459.81]|uniref:Uncharacterized protein n=1 Tax=Lepidopterella palustris CBS 459.81 TaxID=1314670 RepID=A0A8E2E0W5_9PEZI|nr:hypothetical protein K432DRAFT_386380 [Lepidopterella palustris CBS 459.81]
MHSSRWSGEDSEPESEGPWAPPAWQKSHTGWYRKSTLGDSAMRSSPSLSRGASPQYDFQSERDLTPSHIPLPESPMRQSPRTSPEPTSEQDQRFSTPEGQQHSRQHTPGTTMGGEKEVEEQDMADEEVPASAHGEPPANLDGFVRFAVRAEGLFRTAPIEESISSFANSIKVFTKSRLNIIGGIFFLFIAWTLFQPWDAGLMPDLANAASMARQFEPLLYASENVIPRSRELAEASIAIQDLAESLRASNMSGSTSIIEQLEGQAESVRKLSEMLTSFFTNVDGDIDGILITMEWTKREIEAIQPTSMSSLAIAAGNAHSALCRVGVLERNGEPTAVGRVVTKIVGQTPQQHALSTVQRTFNYLVTTVEESVTSELHKAASLFTLFETVNRQFQTLHRSVAREEDSLSTQKDEFLASLWHKSLPNRMKLKKYEKNVKLLKSVRASTLENLKDLKEHYRVINSVREQLDGARRKLVSPLIKSAQSNSFGLDHQLADLSGTYSYLKELRDTQKRNVLQKLWADPKKRVTITSGRGDEEADDY